MRFTYSFQNIVNLKKSQKDHSEWDFSKANRQLEECKLELLELHQKKNDVLEEMSQVTAMHELHHFQIYLSHLEEKILLKQRQLSMAKKEVSNKKETLHENVREEKKWIKAREKAQLGFEQEKARKEQNELDEIATRTYYQRTRV